MRRALKLVKKFFRQVLSFALILPALPLLLVVFAMSDVKFIRHKGKSIGIIVRARREFMDELDEKGGEE